MIKELNNKKIIKDILIEIIDTLITQTLPKNPAIGGSPAIDIRRKIIYSLFIIRDVCILWNMLLFLSEKIK